MARESLEAILKAIISFFKIRIELKLNQTIAFWPSIQFFFAYNLIVVYIGMSEVDQQYPWLQSNPEEQHF